MSSFFGRLLQQTGLATDQQPTRDSVTAPLLDEAEIKSFDKFTAQVEEVEDDIRSSEGALARLDGLVRVDSILQERKAAKECLETLARQATALEGKVSHLMQSLAEGRAGRDGAEPSAHDRMKEAMTRNLRRKIMDLRSRFPAIEERILLDKADSLKRRETMGKEEAATAKGLFSAISLSRKAAEATQTMKLQHDAVTSIQKELLALHGLFLQVAMHVEEGGDMLDDIEAQAQAVAEKTHAATGDVELAVESQQKRRRLCCCFSLVAAFLVVLGICGILFVFRTEIFPGLFLGLTTGSGGEAANLEDTQGSS